ncbi:HET domain protein [Lasiosphaeria ovina]|uniref:HET domain protein n=1 Tax=Lasiosphaeria ovina TaxID=92902 RepID=A0AAE0JSV0_9PEZI|nr:HET domain protein [Lasiosphaeria ovina]
MAGTATDPFLESIADCSFCLDLNRAYLRRQYRRFGLLDPQELEYGFTLAKMAENASRTDCNGCRLLLRAAQRIKDEHGMDFRHAALEYLDGAGSGTLDGLCLRLSMLYPSHATQDEWDRARARPDLYRITIVSRPSRDDRDRAIEDRISSPLYEVFRAQTAVPRNSALCNNPPADKQQRLPTRLLDLGPDLSLPTADPRLHITTVNDTASGETEYICLSHCWGVPGRHQPPLETTQETFEAFQQAIPWAQIPLTFRDAIIFTRRLGIRYLWIDSLCIIQHDGDDWQREVGRMASVYENATLTLAAASSSNSHEGLFRLFSPAEMPLSSAADDGGNGNEHWPSEIRLRRYPDPGFFDFRQDGSYSRTRGNSSSGVSPLLQRAWVFQERILSRRVLYFTPMELVLECRQSSGSESGLRWIDSANNNNNNNNNNNAIPALLWRSLVEDFTRLKLTRASDTLPAMAGLAKYLLPDGVAESDIGSAYFAGLWRESFLGDMLWEVVSGSDNGPAKTNASVPSWSWARTDAPKSFMTETTKTYLCDVVSVSCDSAGGESALLRVDGGRAVISGFLLPAKETPGGIEIDQVPHVSTAMSKDYNWSEPDQDAGDIKADMGDAIFVLPVGVFAQQDSRGYGQIPALVLKEVLSPGIIPALKGESDGLRTFRRIGTTTASVFGLKDHHQAILEGNDTLAAALRSDVEFGESMFAKEQQLYQAPPSRRSRMLQHRDAAFLHYSQNGGAEKFGNFNDFHGVPHLETVKAELRIEEARLAEWKRCEEAGAKHGRERDVVCII